MTNNDLRDERDRASRLHLHGLVAHWQEADQAGWARTLGGWEESERAWRSLERRLKDVRIGRFKPLVDFDWSFPTRCDRQAIESLMRLDFIRDAANAAFDILTEIRDRIWDQYNIQIQTELQNQLSCDDHP